MGPFDGLGMPQSAKVTGMVPLMATVLPVRLAFRSTVTGLVVPCRVRSPVAVADTVEPSAGTLARAMGLVSLKVAVGKLLTSMTRPRNWLSRRDSSLVTVAMSTLRSTAFTVVPSITMVPVTLLVRPTAVFFWPNSTSLTR